MTISSSLNAGVAGLSANANRLATISDNIANSATYGYKRAVTDFHSMVISQGEGSYSAGGVRTTTQRLIDERGPLVTTDNSTDVAVRGRGMIPVTEASSIDADAGSPLLLATTGSFRTDREGYLTTTSGLVLMGWPANSDGTIPPFPRDTIEGLEPIRLNTTVFSGSPTTQLDLALNLPATATDVTSPDAGEVIETTVEYYDNLGKAERLSISYVPTVPAAGSSNEWTMIIEDSASGGAVVGEYTLTFDDTRALGGSMQSVAAVSGGAYDPATGSFSVNVAGGPVEITIGELGSANGITQLSGAYSPGAISRDGSPIGNMTSVEIDANGYVHAYADNGISRVIYQVPLVDVPNPNALLTKDHQSYQVTPDSGQFLLWDAVDGPTGDILGYAREESATDVAGELTDLIQTQRAYSSNAKVIQTVDEMLQETTNIKR